jgi:hypothetical protein
MFMSLRHVFCQPDNTLTIDYKKKRNLKNLSSARLLKNECVLVGNERMISIPRPVLEYTEIFCRRPITSLVFSFYNGRSPMGCGCKQ